MVIPVFSLGNALILLSLNLSASNKLEERKEEKKGREAGREEGRGTGRTSQVRSSEKLPLNSNLLQVPCLLSSILGQNTASLAKGREKPESLVRKGSARKSSDTMDGGLFLIWTNVKSISSSVPSPQPPAKL